MLAGWLSAQFGPQLLPHHPTAHTSLVESADTASRKAEPGFGIRFQAEPFQCSVEPSPTAHTSLDEIAATAFRSPEPGLAMILHVVPSQCTVSGAVGLPDPPTAHTSLAETASTPYRRL